MALTNMPESIRLLTYNIHKGMSTTNRRFVLEEIRHSLRLVDADLLLLQEIHGHHEGSTKKISEWSGSNQLEYLADEVWTHHSYGKNAVYQRGHHGNAVLSKYPIVGTNNVDVSLMKRASRSLLHATINLPGNEKLLQVICVHLGLFGFERDRQLQRLADYVEEEINQHDALIIAGDFNDWRGHASRYLSEQNGFSEVFEASKGAAARTFPSLMPILRMDRIFVRGCELTDCWHLHGSPWKRLSDHVPLLAEVKI